MEEEREQPEVPEEPRDEGATGQQKNSELPPPDHEFWAWLRSRFERVR